MTDFAEHLQTALGDGYQLQSELTGGGMSRGWAAMYRARAALSIRRWPPLDRTVFTWPESTSRRTVSGLTLRSSAA